MENSSIATAFDFAQYGLSSRRRYRAGVILMLHRLLRFWLRGRPAGGPSGGRGAAGEEFAAEFLRDKMGYRMVAQNWRNPRDERQEIDLVCRDHEVLVFVEVKSRSAAAQVSGYFAVNQRKKRALRRAIHAYLTQLRSRPRTFRFDIAEVILSGGAAPEVLHFQNIPLFPRGYNVMREEPVGPRPPRASAE